MPRHSQLRLTRAIMLLTAMLTLLVITSPTIVDQLAVADESTETVREAPFRIPSDAVLQEMHDLLAETTRLQIGQRYHKQFLPGGKQFFGTESKKHARAVHELARTKSRLTAISNRLEEIHEKDLGQYERVAEDAVLECSEEPLYGQPSYGVILYAESVMPIRANELLLFHAGGIYRTEGEFRPLRTTGQGFYFRPNVFVPDGQQFVVACIQDAPEEIANVKNGFMPDSDRARDPSRPYRTQIFGRGGAPLVSAE